MSQYRLLLLLLILFSSTISVAQTDSVVQTLQNISFEYISGIENKVDKYSYQITSKIEKTLQRLSKWENKIHDLLLKINPQAAENLFGNNQTSFSTLLQKIKEGKSIAENYQAKYDEYRDKLTTSISYLQKKKDSLKAKFITPLSDASKIARRDKKCE